jgi:hypothetical protein
LDLKLLPIKKKHLIELISKSTAFITDDSNNIELFNILTNKRINMILMINNFDIIPDLNESNEQQEFKSNNDNLLMLEYSRKLAKITDINLEVSYGIPVYFLYLGFIKLHIKNSKTIDINIFSDIITKEIKENILLFLNLFLENDFNDNLHNSKLNPDFDNTCDKDKLLNNFIEHFLNKTPEDAYGGNGSYDPWTLSRNYAREIIKYFDEYH